MVGILILAALLLSSCAPSEAAMETAIVQTQASVPTNTPSPTATAAAWLWISPAEAHAKYQEGAFFIDVRSQGEWNVAHIRGSVLIPLEELQNRLVELPHDKDVVLVCWAGSRGSIAAGILQQAGFRRVSVLSGGLQAWTQEDYPIDRGP